MIITLVGDAINTSQISPLYQIRCLTKPKSHKFKRLEVLTLVLILIKELQTSNKFKFVVRYTPVLRKKLFPQVGIRKRSIDKLPKLVSKCYLLLQVANLGMTMPS